MHSSKKKRKKKNFCKWFRHGLELTRQIQKPYLLHCFFPSIEQLWFSRTFKQTCPIVLACKLCFLTLFLICHCWHEFSSPQTVELTESDWIIEGPCVSGTRRRLRQEVEVIAGGAGLPVTLHSHPALISPRAQPPTMVGHLGQIALVFKNNKIWEPWCMTETWPWECTKKHFLSLDLC